MLPPPRPIIINLRGAGWTISPAIIVTAIAIDRWLSITKVSNGFPTKLTHTKVILINILIWTLAFLLASPVLVFQTIDTVSLPWSSFSMCVEVWPAQWMKNTFTIIILFVQYLLPLIVLPLVHSQVCHASDKTKQDLISNCNILDFKVS